VSEAESERFWNQKARENALYYVDNRVDYNAPDADAFWRGGDEVLDVLLASAGLALRPDEEVADIGCGVGRISRALARRVRRVYGIDVASEMLALAAEHNRDVDNIEWLHGDGRTLRVLADGSVDGCVSHVVFQHLPDPEMTLSYVREMGRVLRPGGWALFQVSMDPAVHRRKLGPRARVRNLLGRVDADAAWWGSAVDGAALRQAASDGSLTIERLLGEGTQYATVYARRASSSR
jgi:SAM-dependent methyltransferase